MFRRTTTWSNADDVYVEDGLENTPNSPPDSARRRRTARERSTLAQLASASGIPIVPHRAVLTSALDHRHPCRETASGNLMHRHPGIAHAGSGACFGYALLSRCSIRANYHLRLCTCRRAWTSARHPRHSIVRKTLARTSRRALSSSSQAASGRGRRAPVFPAASACETCVSAQFAVCATSAGTSQLERETRPLSHGHGRQLGVRPDSAP